MVTTSLNCQFLDTIYMVFYNPIIRTEDSRESVEHKFFLLKNEKFCLERRSTHTLLFPSQETYYIEM